MTELGTELRRRREASGWSRRELAQRVGVNPATIENIERSGALPTDPTLAALCAVLDIPRDLADTLWRQSAESERRRFAVPRPVL